MSNQIPPINESVIIGNTDIISGNVSSSKVYQPQWINNQTRLNETNINVMRSNLINYVNRVSGSLYKSLIEHYNKLVKENAGWVVIENNTSYGEIFNDYQNNTVDNKYRYQVAFGTYTNAKGEAQFVCGKYNAEVENALFIVGCGNSTTTYEIVAKGTTFDPNNTYYTKDGDTYTEAKISSFEEGKDYYTQTITENRENALVIKADGSVEIIKNTKINGTLMVTGTPTEPTHVVRKKELDELRSELRGALHYIGVTKSLTVETENGNQIVIYDDTKDFEVFEYYDEKTKTNKFTTVSLSNGDVAIIGKWLDSDGQEVTEVPEDTTGLIFTATGDECIYNDGKWTYYGAYANYVPLKEAVGKKTQYGGEIFNLYEPIEEGDILYENKAISPYTHTDGYGNTAGSMGYQLVFARKLVENGVSTNCLELCVKGTDALNTLTEDVLTNIIVNATKYELESSVSFQWGNCFDLAANILSVGYDEDTDCTVIKLDKIPTGLTNHLINTNSSGWIWFPTNPEIGNVTIGTAANAGGSSNKAVQIASNTQGYNNISAGKYSSTRGHSNIAGYASDASGRKTRAIGNVTHTEGQETEALGSYSHAQNWKTQALGQSSNSQGSGTIAGGKNSDAGGYGTNAMYDNQTTRGTYNLNKADTLFEIGNGESNEKRSNAFEVYKDGHAEVSRMGTTDESVTTKKYVDNSTTGKKTAEGGEVFNNYEDNKALGLYSTVRGNGNTAGYLAYGYRAIDLESKQIYLSAEPVYDSADIKISSVAFTDSEKAEYTSDTIVPEYSEDDKLTVIIDGVSYVVTIIDVDNNIITYSGDILYPIKAIKDYYVGYGGTGKGTSLSDLAPSVAEAVTTMNIDGLGVGDTANIWIMQDIAEVQNDGTVVDSGTTYNKHNLAYWGSVPSHTAKISVKPYENNQANNAEANLPTYLAISDRVGINARMNFAGPTEIDNIKIIYCTSTQTRNQERGIINFAGNSVKLGSGVEYGYANTTKATSTTWVGDIKDMTSLTTILTSPVITEKVFEKPINVEIAHSITATNGKGGYIYIPSIEPAYNTFEKDVTLRITGPVNTGRLELGESTNAYPITFKQNLNVKITEDGGSWQIANGGNIIVEGGIQMIVNDEATIRGDSYPFSTIYAKAYTDDTYETPITDHWILKVNDAMVDSIDFVEGQKGKFKVPLYKTIEVIRTGSDDKYISDENGIVDLSSVPGEYEVIALYDTEYYQPKNVVYVTTKPTVGTVPQGKGSIADGLNTSAFGDYSHSSGIGTVAIDEGETVVGKYNDYTSNNKKRVFTVGSGTSDNDRRNSIEVYDDGSTIIKNITIKDLPDPVDDGDAVNLKYVKDNVITADLQEDLNEIGTNLERIEQKVDNLQENPPVLVSENAPEQTDGIIWLQPIIEDTGAQDYIVEQGIYTSKAVLNNINPQENYEYLTTWTYRKWNSGIAECWGNIRPSDAMITYKIDKTYGNSYISDITTIYFPENLFVDTPIVTAQFSTQEQNYGMAHAIVREVWQHFFEIGIIDFTNAEKSGFFGCRVIGRWK